MVSMRRIINDVKFFGRGYLRNRIGLFFGLIFPVILILIFGAVFSGSSGPITVYVQNQDNGQISALFMNALENTGTVKVVQVNASENFSHYLSDQSSSDGIVIPQNFSSSYVAGNPVNIIVYSNPAQSSSAIVTGTVNGVINAFNLQHYGGSPIIGMSQTTVNENVYNYIDFLIPGLIGFSVLVNPMFSLVQISSEYKKRKLFKQLSLTPITKIEWLASKVIWYIILVSNVLFDDGCGGSRCLRRAYFAVTLAYTFLDSRADAFRFDGHASRNCCQDYRDGQRNWEYRNISHDVSCRHILSNQHHARILAILRTCSATILHNRWTKRSYGLRQLCRGINRYCRCCFDDTCHFHCRSETVQVERRLARAMKRSYFLSGAAGGI